MSELTDSDRASVIQSLLDNAGWVRWLQPILFTRMSANMKALAGEKSDSDDVKRGWIQALNWVLSLPAQELENIKVSEREAAKTAETDVEDEYRARFGYRSPFAKAPAPGETKSDGDGTTPLP